MRIKIFIFILISQFAFAQTTYVPDNNFEQALIGLAVAGGGAAVAFSDGSEIGEPPTFPTVT